MSGGERSLPAISLKGSRLQDVALFVCLASATASVFEVGAMALCVLLPAASIALYLRRSSGSLQSLASSPDGRLSVRDCSGRVSEMAVLRARCSRSWISLLRNGDAARGRRQLMLWVDQFEDPDHFRVLSAYLRSARRPGGSGADEAGSL